MRDELLVRVIDRTENKYFGKYRGFVVDNQDGENRGRLKLRIPSVLGDSVVSGWALPCTPYGGAANQGMVFIPERDAGVWVEFEAGDLEYPIWVGTFWSKPGGTTELPQPTAKQSPPTSKVIRTMKHTIELADADGSEAIIIRDETHKHVITIDKNGINVEDGKSNKITMAAAGITITDANGNSITMDKTSGGIPGTAGVKINGEKKVCLDGLITWLMSHQHIGNMGAPTPLSPADIAKLTPVLAAPDGDILSKGVKLG